MDVLYKYVSGDRVLSCIPEVGDGTLRATQPAALNDPFECAVLPTYVFADEQREDRELASALTVINENRPVSPDEVRQARSEYGSFFTRQLFVEQISTRFGFVSFAADPYNPLMWSHYTVDGSGFVIGYDADVISGLVGMRGWLRQVDYRDKLPFILGPSVVISPASNLPIFLSMKSSRWSHENEWRLIVELSLTVGTAERDRWGLPVNLLRIPNEAVRSVHYTERTLPELVGKIRDRLRDANNRYGAREPTKLVLSETAYDYAEAEHKPKSPQHPAQP